MGPTKKQFLSSAQVHSTDYGFAALGWQRNPCGRGLVPFVARNSANPLIIGSERDEIDEPSLSLPGDAIKNIRHLKSLETETAYSRRYKLLNAV